MPEEPHFPHTLPGCPGALACGLYRLRLDLPGWRQAQEPTLGTKRRSLAGDQALAGKQRSRIEADEDRMTRSSIKKYFQS